MQATYVSSNQFRVSTDKTAEFLAGRRIRANCGGSYKYSTIQSSIYSDPNTTVTIEESILTSNLTEVHYGIVNIGDQGSFPEHSHNGDEGTGGELSLLTLSDTPDIYENGEYLRSTTSGVEWTIPEAEIVVVRVKEENVSAITKGQVCTVVTGSSGIKVEVGLCDCDNPDKIRILGLAQNNISQNGEGIVAYKGVLTNIDTRITNSDINPNGETWISGDLLWSANTPGGMTNVRPTSGRSIKAARTIKGNSATDALIIISLENPIWNTAAAGEDVVLRTGDSAGVNKVSIRNYDNDEVADFDSYGNLTISGTVDGVDVATFKSDFDSHDHDDKYYTESEVDTISGTLQTEIDTKSDTELFLTEGVPSVLIGKEDDIAIDQEVGIIYKKFVEESFILETPTTWNPSDTSAGMSLSNGNLTVTNGTAAWRGSRSISGKNSGKWYCEVVINHLDTGDSLVFGISLNSIELTALRTEGWAYQGNGYKTSSAGQVSYGQTCIVGDTISMAFDMDNGKIWWGKNGIWFNSGDPVNGTNEAFSGLSGTFYSHVMYYWASDGLTANFGASSFSYTVPTGFVDGLGEGVIGGGWTKKLTPDFLKLSDTPGSYDEGKYLKTTNSGIEFSDIEASSFLDLTDTPNSYAGIEDNYLRTTASGITTVSGIVLKASDSSQWRLCVTNSGTLYTASI